MQTQNSGVSSLQSNTCNFTLISISECGGFEADAQNYASTTYEDMMKDIDEAGEFLRKMWDDIYDVATLPLEDFPGLCDYLDQHKGEKCICLQGTPNDNK